MRSLPGKKQKAGFRRHSLLCPLIKLKQKQSDLAGRGERDHCLRRSDIQEVKESECRFILPAAAVEPVSQSPASQSPPSPPPKVTVRSRGRHHRHHYSHTSKGSTTLLRSKVLLPNLTRRILRLQEIMEILSTLYSSVALFITFSLLSNISPVVGSFPTKVSGTGSPPPAAFLEIMRSGFYFLSGKELRLGGGGAWKAEWNKWRRHATAAEWKQSETRTSGSSYHSTRAGSKEPTTAG